MAIFHEITLHDFSKPLADRAKSRQHCGPYTWCPAGSHLQARGRSFYLRNARASDRMEAGTMRLRIEDANEHLPAGSRTREICGYWVDYDDATTFAPIVARLPRGRGYLAGYTMGEGMASSLDAAIYSDAEEAARAAHTLADCAAHNKREYQAKWRDAQNRIDDIDTEIDDLHSNIPGADECDILDPCDWISDISREIADLQRERDELVRKFG